MTAKHRSGFIADLAGIVGAAHVLTEAGAVRGYCRGLRFGGGSALAVVRPGSLVEQWRILNACVAANKIVILQATNTSLTGGATPAGDDYDRDVVLISTTRLTGLHIIDDARQVICLPGTTLHQLEKALEPFGREPHSVIGSSCIGASVIGGVCNNSGGALIRRGPAYTQMALFSRADASGALQLVNHLRVQLGQEPEQMLRRLERGALTAADIEHDPARCGSDHDYARLVREIDADSPARFNANPQRLFEASGSAGKLAVFAVRLDTFPKERRTRVFYIGANDVQQLTDLRRRILGQFHHLPIAAEYMHREMFDVAAAYGKDMFLLIRLLGANHLPRLMRSKRAFDAMMSRLGVTGSGAGDRLLQRLSRLAPDHLPRRVRLWRHRFEHHLIVRVGETGLVEARAHLRSIFPSSSGDFFECTQKEGELAFLHRFVAAGAAIRYRELHQHELGEIVSLDIALRRNDREWFEVLPDEIRSQVHLALYYGHFFCHVFHQDYILRKGVDPVALEHQLWRLLDARGAEYPAEHNVGHVYAAKPALAGFYRTLDPSNRFNPGIGQTSKRAEWTSVSTGRHSS